MNNTQPNKTELPDIQSTTLDDDVEEIHTEET